MRRDLSLAANLELSDKAICKIPTRRGDSMKIKFAAAVALCLLTSGSVAVLHVLFDQRAFAQTTSTTEDDGYLNTVF
jgi:hypothetical protein